MNSKKFHHNMNLSISNIAWKAEYDSEMYKYLETTGFNGLEIAPTRIFPENPYDHLSEAKEYVLQLKNEFGLVISSMQSIWYSRKENIFTSNVERKLLTDYTRKACVFANTIGCKNLVFGNPRNRDTLDIIGNYPKAIDFFHAIGEIALENDTIIAIEPNPIIYNTHFINYTEQAVELVNKANSAGVKVNFDLGSVIYNGEDIRYLETITEYVNHIHISEPFLKPILKRKQIHTFVINIARNLLPNHFISIEMSNTESLEDVKRAMEYIKCLTE